MIAEPKCARCDDTGCTACDPEWAEHQRPSEPPATDDLVRKLRKINVYEANESLRLLAADLIERQAREIARLDRENQGALECVEQANAAVELAEAERDNARAVTRDICEEWTEKCECADLPMALGHDADCKATSIRAAKAALQAERDALLDRLAAAERDAERYRHILPMFRAFSVHINGQHSWCATGELGRMKGPTFNAAIDAARAKVGP